MSESIRGGFKTRVLIARIRIEILCRIIGTEYRFLQRHQKRHKRRPAMVGGAIGGRGAPGEICQY